jgi:uncharacterized Fe-S cluster protein YjdI
MRRKEYRSEQIVVSFDLKRCIHARYCVRAFPRCSTRATDPGCVPSAKAEHVAEIVMRCPSGALQFEHTDDTTEPIPQQNTPSRHSGE